MIEERLRTEILSQTRRFRLQLCPLSLQLLLGTFSEVFAEELANSVPGLL